MVDVFITDSGEEYKQSTHPDKILYLDGFIGACSFVSRERIEELNATLVGTDDEACRLMLQVLDVDVKTIIDRHLTFGANRFISQLGPADKAISALFNFHRHFVFNKYLLGLALDKFFTYFSILPAPLILSLSEDHYLAGELPFEIKSATYRSAFKNVYLKVLAKQAYYFFRRLFSKAQAFSKTQIAICLFDIHNEFDVFRKFIELAKAENKVAITIVVIDSGNPPEKKVDTSMYEGGNVKVVHLYQQKANLLSDYSSFYDICREINPLYSIFKKARFCELEDIQYGFMDNVISQLSPDVCLYANIQEYGRVVANVCAAHHISSICVEYAFAFDTYIMEKRIRFDLRACISQVTAQNWAKHKDPTPRHEIIGFCKIDDWQDRINSDQRSVAGRIFNNGRRTILFASTWAPNPNSPLLTEKVQIVEQLSEICARNGWNLIIKKHPSEFDDLIDTAFKNKDYMHLKVFQHHEMSLFDCVHSSDFVCTQNSSAFVEALYLNKPFSYISASMDNNWANMSYFAKEKEVVTFGSVLDYEKYLLSYEGDTAYQGLLSDFAKLQTKYLYKTDSRASERLLALARSFIK